MLTYTCMEEGKVAVIVNFNKNFEHYSGIHALMYSITKFNCAHREL
jgi:hypothetical protein